MILWIADNGNPNAETLSRGTLRHGLRGVVRSFGVNVRAKILEQRVDTWFAEEDDVIDSAKRSDEERSRVFIKNGTAGAFQRADARVRIHADHKDVAFAARALQITDVAHVKGIKASVGKDDALALLFVLSQFFLEALPCDDLGFRVAHHSGGGPACLMANGGEKLIPRDGGGATLHDNEAASNVSDVRSFQRRGAAGQRNRVHGKNRVARTRDVYSLVASVDGYLRQTLSRLEERHAVAASRNEQRAQLHFAKCRGTAASQF